MLTPYVLMKCVTRALVRYASNGMGLGVAGDLIVDVWEEYRKQPGEAARRMDLEATAQLPLAEALKRAEEIVREVAADQTEDMRRDMVAYTAQIPATIRRSMRRPSDPSGRTVPPHLALRGPEDLCRILPPCLPRFKPGDRPLGADLELVEPLGIGGYGEVWKARNFDLGTMPFVALKFCIDPASKDRLLHEASLISRLQSECVHPGIVRLRQSYRRADPPCLEYEYVDGGELTGWILEWHSPARGGPPPQYVGGLIARLSEIVGFAHRLSPAIVHRDLKPANILVQNGQAGLQFKITDFGLGGIVSAPTRPNPGDGIALGLPRPSIMAGSYTPLYASIQQQRNCPTDPRDDVYALGVVWFQMLTGDLSRGAPRGRSWHGRLQRDGMIPELIDLLADCIDDDPASRPADAAELSARITGLLAARPLMKLVDDGKRLLESGGYDEAGIVFSEALRLQPDSPDALFWSARLSFERREIEDALHYLESAQSQGFADRAQVAFWAFRCLFTYHDPGKEPWDVRIDIDRELLLNAIDMDPGNAAYKFWLGKIMAGHGGEDARAAVEHVREAVGLAPGETEYRIGLSELYSRSGQLEDAMTCLQAAVGIEPGDAEVHRMLGDVYAAEARRYDWGEPGSNATPAHDQEGVMELMGKALRCYEEAFRLGATGGRILCDLADSAFSVADYEKSAYWYGRYSLSEGYDFDFDDWTKHAIACFHAGAYEQSIEMLNSLHDCESQYWLGRARLALGDYSQALGHFEAARQAYDDDGCVEHFKDEDLVAWTDKAARETRSGA